MTTKSPKLPEKVYVTFKKQPKYDNGVVVGYDTPLGFLNAYEPQKKTWQSKMNTQLDWAYREYINDFRCEDRNGHLWISGWKYEGWLAGTSQRNKVVVGEYGARNL